MLLGWLAMAPAHAGIELDDAITMAQANDPWLAGSRMREEALRADSIAASSLPDPMVSVGLANLPTDTFDFDQEAMTQFKVGVSQVFPRGESRALGERRYRLLGEAQPHQRDDRRARVALEVTRQWLQAYRASASIALIERDRDLFEQLLEVVQASYTSALGRTRQQDLIRAQLELTRLDERLSRLREDQQTSLSQLLEWLSPLDYGGLSALSMTRRPDIELLRRDIIARVTDETVVGQLLSRHPAVLATDAQVSASAATIAMAEQGYRPQWRLDASYGYRDDDPLRGERADFFSVGVAFDLPLFTEKRQDQGVRSATAATEALRTERALLLRRLYARFEVERKRLAALEERQRLYRERLLAEMREQAEASLAAYTNDDGDFAEVVRARIAELNANIEALDIDVQRLLSVSQLNYLLAGEEVSS
jgi:outer membrane protein TolC